jgi:hypothetical protein
MGLMDTTDVAVTTVDGAQVVVIAIYGLMQAFSALRDAKVQCAGILVATVLWLVRAVFEVFVAPIDGAVVPVHAVRWSELSAIGVALIDSFMLALAVSEIAPVLGARVLIVARDPLGQTTAIRVACFHGARVTVAGADNRLAFFATTEDTSSAKGIRVAVQGLGALVAVIAGCGVQGEMAPEVRFTEIVSAQVVVIANEEPLRRAESIVTLVANRARVVVIALFFIWEVLALPLR